VRNALILCAIATLSCAHPNRVSRRALEKMTNSGEKVVLVFGSLSTPKGTLDRPAIRFLHAEKAPLQDDLLWQLTVSSGDRFYAVLHAPREAAYLDSFYTEVGSADAGFDRIFYRHIGEGEAPLALYVGELSVSPAQVREQQGQKVAVTTRDDFENAQLELRRLYPRFAGAIAKSGLLRNPTRVQ
jgi:hypothetical protein